MARFRRLLLCAALVLLLACGAEAWAKKKKAKDEVVVKQVGVSLSQVPARHVHCMQ